jgi:hemerythrin
MTLLVWQDEKHLLGFPDMDDTHKEFAELLNSLGEMTDSDKFKAGFAQLVLHTKNHFDKEDRLMVESSFPAIGEHRSDHDRVLGQLTQINERVQRGIIALGREYIKALPNWFDVHAATMDSALAAHLKVRG